MKQYNWSFGLFSANLHHYLPQVPWAEHERLYELWIAHHQPRAVYTDQKWNLSLLSSSIFRQPSILCCYHLGYHAQLPLLLADHGLRFDMILDRNVYKCHRDALDSMQRAMGDLGYTYRYLMSDEPKVLVQSRNTLREGRHLLVFADGNSGALQGQSRRVKVDFLENKIYVRKGIGLISYLTGSSIIPLSHCEEADELHLFSGEPITPLGFCKRDDYLGYVAQELYHFLEVQIKDQPWLWESWGYLHELRCFDWGEQRFAGESVQTDSSPAAIPLSLAGRAGLFDRSKYCFKFH